jgi:DNA-binding Lrp family transcriptional regulator
MIGRDGAVLGKHRKRRVEWTTVAVRKLDPRATRTCVVPVAPEAHDGCSSTEGTSVMEAYVLIQTAVGRSTRVGQAVAEVQGVISSDVVTGPYDVIARVEGADIDAVGKLTLGGIQAVDGVVRTLTCPVVRF